MSQSKEPTYRYERLDNHTAFGTVHEFHGPFLSRYTNGVHFLQPLNDQAIEKYTSDYADHEAEKIVSMLHAAYEAGRQSMQKDFQDLLGINK